jgi:chitinase
VPASGSGSSAGAGSSSGFTLGSSSDASTRGASAGAGARAFTIDAYFPGYEAKMLPLARVDFDALDQLVVARVVPRADGSLDTSFDTDKGIEFADAAARAASTAQRKATLMVGGEGAHTGFVNAAKDPSKRERLARELVKFAQAHRFDGLDIDWEPIEAADHAPLLALLDALRAAAPTLALTIPVGWDTKPDPFYAELAKRVARINIMTYAMAGAWPQWSSWHSSALHGDTPQTPSSVSRAVKSYLDSGVPRATLGVGAGFFGQCWQKVSGPGQQLNGARVVAGDGALSFAEISRTYKPLAEKSGELVYDEGARAPTLRFKTPAGPKQCTWISYEDERSLREKAQFVKAEHLAGIIVWTLPQGFVTERGEHPLLRVLKEEAAR